MGRQHAENLAWRMPGTRLARLVDANAELARATAERLGGIPWSTRFEDLLTDQTVDMVVIASPTPVHAEMVEAAAAAGKHIFCEKPLSLDMDRTRAAIAAARSAGVKLQIGFHRRFDPDFRAVKRTIQDGDAGQIYLFRASCRDMQAPSFEYIRASGGMYVDNAVVTLRFASGALGVIDNSRVAGYGYECSAEIIGSRMTLRIGNHGAHRQVGVDYLTAGSSRHDYVADFVQRFHTAYLVEMEAFCTAVREDLEPEVTGEDAAAAFALAQAAQRSQQEGRPVRLAEMLTPAGQ
jgi:myo-inositol 2-dehydrogenase/D-chiro-inositol 1-dehydrogenase